MNIDALAESPVGRLVPLQGHDARHGDFAYFGFVPLPLPDDLPLGSQTWTSVAHATAALAKLDQACGQLPDPRLLIRPALWREALDSSALEGTVAPLQDLLEAQLPGAHYLSPEAVEVNAYVTVAIEAFEMIRHRPISISLLSELQAELFRNAKNPPRDIGRVRQEPVWIGEKDQPIQLSRFVPAPPDDRLISGLEEWEAWVSRGRSHFPPVLDAALGHYQFETLHPYGDGNGRLGRLVVVLQLLGEGAITEPAITISPWFLRRRSQYQDELLRVSSTGEWDPWVQFFCQAVCEQCESLIDGVSQLRDWLERSRQILNAKRWTGKIHRLLQDLVEWPVTTVADTARRYETTIPNATRMIEHLVEVGMMRELTGKSYGRIFGCGEVMGIVDSI